MNRSRFGEGVYGQTQGDSFRENPDLLRAYQNQMAKSRGQTPKGLKNEQKIGPKSVANSPKASGSHWKRNLAITGLAAALPFAGAFLYAETGSAFDERYLPLQLVGPFFQSDNPFSQSFEMPAYMENILQMAAIIGVTAQTVADESSSSKQGFQNGTWRESLPETDYKHPEKYNLPIEYKIGKDVTLMVESNTRDVKDSVQVYMTVENNGPVDIEVVDISISADKCFSKIEERTDMSLDTISPGKSRRYGWELYLSGNPLCNQTVYATPHLKYGFTNRGSINGQTVKFEGGPLKISRSASEPKKQDSKTTGYMLTLDFTNKGNGILNLEEAKKGDAPFCDGVLGAYNPGQTNQCGNIVVGKDEQLDLTAKGSYGINIGRALKIVCYK
jgi:hypothetical protein